MHSLLLTLGLVLLAGCSPQVETISIWADRTAAVADGFDAILITATRTAPDGSPVSQFIDFTVARADGSFDSSRVSSDASGVSTLKLTANTPGSVDVRVSVPWVGEGRPQGGSVSLTFTAAIGQRLRFRTSPWNEFLSHQLWPLPVVEVADGPAVVTSSTVPVTLSVTPGSCDAVLTAMSQVTENAVRGVAHFNFLQMSAVASGCTLTAASPDLPSAVSTPFDVL